MQAAGDWTLHPWLPNKHPWLHNNVGGVIAGQARHNSSNVGVSLRAKCDTTLVHNSNNNNSNNNNNNSNNNNKHAGG